MSKTVLVTGATSGIGLHLSEHLVQQGYRVMAVGRSHDKLRAMIAAHGWTEDQISVESLDVRDAAQWQTVLERLLERWGKIDVLINNAGMVEPGQIYAVTPELIDNIIDTNVKGTLYGTQLVAAQMIQQKSGHIITVASLAGLFPIPGSSVYAASKWALRGFSLSIAHELRQHGVAVTCIFPDSVKTPQLAHEAQYEDAAMSFSSSKLLSVEDMAKAVMTALKSRPVELAVPRTQGWLARLGLMFPALTLCVFVPGMMKDGCKNQAKYRATLDG